MIDQALGNRIIELRSRIVRHFDKGNWEELGLLTGQADIINGHSRLLRSLHFSDDDYEGNVLIVLRQMVEDEPRSIATIESYLNSKFPGEGEYISPKPSERVIKFAPNVFQVPDAYVEPDLVALMMPFAAEFDSVHAAIKSVCAKVRLRCIRVDDIWEESVLVQDIFSLIFRAQAVIVDFSGRNPNVMYETGIAHTLGKHVLPITQSIGDVPFDLSHHRVVKYLPNREGLAALRAKLAPRLEKVCIVPKPSTAKRSSTPSDDNVPF